MKIDMETTYGRVEYHFEGRRSQNNEEGIMQNVC